MFPAVSFVEFMTKKERGGVLKSPKSRHSARRKRYRAEGQNAPYMNSTTNIMIDNQEKAKHKTFNEDNSKDVTLQADEEEKM